MLAHGVMQVRQLVKRNGRQCMMLRMKGHIPRHQPYQLRRESRARIFKHVLDMRAVRVLGQEKEPQERLAEEGSDDPQKTDAAAIKT